MRRAKQTFHLIFVLFFLNIGAALIWQFISWDTVPGFKGKALQRHHIKRVLYWNSLTWLAIQSWGWGRENACTSGESGFDSPTYKMGFCLPAETDALFNSPTCFEEGKKGSYEKGNHQLTYSLELSSPLWHHKVMMLVFCFVFCMPSVQIAAGIRNWNCPYSEWLRWLICSMYFRRHD